MRGNRSDTLEYFNSKIDAVYTDYDILSKSLFDAVNASTLELKMAISTQISKAMDAEASLQALLPVILFTIDRSIDYAALNQTNARTGIDALMNMRISDERNRASTLVSTITVQQAAAFVRLSDLTTAQIAALQQFVDDADAFVKADVGSLLESTQIAKDAYGNATVASINAAGALFASDTANNAANFALTNVGQAIATATQANNDAFSSMIAAYAANATVENAKADGNGAIITGNLAASQANVATAIASTAYSAATTAYLAANAAYTNGNNVYTGIAVVANRATSAFTQGIFAYQQTNSAYFTTNQAWNRANVAWEQANFTFPNATIAWTSINAAYSVSNHASTIAQAAWEVSNAASTLTLVYASYTEGCNSNSWYTLSGFGLFGRICVSTSLYYGRPYDSWSFCRGLGARVCRQSELQAMCLQYNLHGVTSGFYSDHFPLQGYYWTWGSNSCAAGNDLTGILQTTNSYYRCCK